jgi:hypothetical protein
VNLVNKVQRGLDQFANDLFGVFDSKTTVDDEERANVG